MKRVAILVVVLLQLTGCAIKGSLSVSKSRPITSEIVSPCCGGVTLISEDGEQVCQDCGYKVDKDA